ncbi:glycosyltransferase family 52 [Flavobacterium selenitireducens]|uniref:glycosyltransferase family 52 n=1 Tax=Flavobacterium selenitireducens TaxID=2722704 RepID=UPI00168BB529|nr:glycosyltransferase family 52 [Flavobacterium selenitireducens]MBD3582614.1 hypothetical protein [Flavobacterium selenitireducens]
MNQTYVGCSLYHLYVSMLLAYEARRAGQKSLMLLINDRVPDVESLIPGLQKIGVFDDIVAVKAYSILTDFKKHLGTVNYLFNRQNGLVSIYEKNNPELLKREDFIRDSQINMFHIVRTRAYFLIKFPNNYFRMVEEGFQTYRHKMPVLRYLKRKYLIKFPILMGHDPQVKEVLVQHPEKLRDDVLRSKGKTLDLERLQRELTNEQRQDVLECFLGERPGYTGSAKFLLITQPLSEDGIVTEKQKVDVYAKAIEEAKAAGYVVYLKTHPREFTKYSELFSDVKFIPQLFPIEVFNLDPDYKFEVGLTVFSGSLDNLANVENKITLGRDILSNTDEFLKKKLSIPAT